MKYLLTIFITLIIIFIISDVAFAQPPGLPEDPDMAPIDGGLGLLAAAGGAYAYKKLQKNNEKP